MGWELGGWAGVSYYFGDLNSNFDLKDPGPGLGVVARYNFNERLCLKFSLNGGKVQASDINSTNTFEKKRNLSFQTLVGDITTQFEFNFLPYVHGSKDEFFTPYLFSGLSVYNFNPKAEYNGELVELRPLGTEGQFKGEEYYATQLALAVGGGLKVDLSYRWSINVELSARQLFSDYFDDVSGTYPDFDNLEALRGDLGPLAVALSDRSGELGLDPPIGEEGRQRGNSKNNDRYVFLGVGLLYYFGDIRCPEFPDSTPGRRR
ncbi:MAG: outer membrane beta-barrel protein [Saprospiraceae bacterium]|nr:outer membrane beta-barrel protein [Saprospiraceae bacterium]